MALNRKVLANLAIWEPRTFRAISAICAKTENQAFEEMRGVGQVSKQAGPGIEIIEDVILSNWEKAVNKLHSK